jgi:hypothetical protein
MKYALLALGVLLALHPTAAQAKGRERSMQFVYQSMSEPFEKGNCTHQKDASLPYDYTVSCPLRGRTTSYRVHLALSYYPKTNLGLSAYEILYWVTDITDPQHPKGDSSTFWIHQDTPNAKPTVFQLSQGIENDTAALQLVVDNRAGS